MTQSVGSSNLMITPVSSSLSSSIVTLALIRVMYEEVVPQAQHVVLRLAELYHQGSLHIDIIPHFEANVFVANFLVTEVTFVEVARSL